MRAIKTTLALIALLFSASSAANSLSSSFIIYNDSDRTIKISIVDYGPHTLTIRPHAYANVFTAKDNPDIRIDSVS